MSEIKKKKSKVWFYVLMLLLGLVIGFVSAEIMRRVGIHPFF